MTIKNNKISAFQAAIEERYRACMILHSCGDSLGFKNGHFKYTFSTVDIHEQVDEMNGLDALNLDQNNWKASENTLFHLANAECLIESMGHLQEKQLTESLIYHYKKALKNSEGRLPSSYLFFTIPHLNTNKLCPSELRKVGYNSGASTRAACIGLRFSEPEQKQELIKFAIESSKLTHQNPMGFLGAVSLALMVSYAIQGVKIEKWGWTCLKDLDSSKNLILTDKSDECSKNWSKFSGLFKQYLVKKRVDNETNELDETNKEHVSNECAVKIETDVDKRDQFYKSLSDNKWPGSNGLDSLLIAYDALLESKGDWKDLCLRAMLHGGDSSATGCIAGALFGACYGFENVSPNNYEMLFYFKKLELKERLSRSADQLFQIRNVHEI